MTDNDYPLDFDHHDELFSHLDCFEGSTQIPDAEECVSTDPNLVGKSEVGFVAGRTKQGLEFLTAQTTEVSHGTILDPIRQTANLYWLVNTKASRLPHENLPFPPKSDLLKEFDITISKSNSLHVLPHETEQLEPYLTHALKSDSAVCVATDLEYADFVSQVKPMIAWFMKASTLAFQIENGPRLLLENLFATANLICLSDIYTGKWKLFKCLNETLGWHDFGFSVEH